MDTAAPTPPASLSIPLLALLARMDAILTLHGNDPATITPADKIMLAVQYLEVANMQGVLDQVTEGLYRL
jgi:hypothetical protein